MSTLNQLNSQLDRLNTEIDQIEFKQTHYPIINNDRGIESKKKEAIRISKLIKKKKSCIYRLFNILRI